MTTRCKVAGVLALVMLPACRPGERTDEAAPPRPAQVSASLQEPAELGLPALEERLATIYEEVNPSVVSISMLKEVGHLQDELGLGDALPFGFPGQPRQQPGDPSSKQKLVAGSGSGFVWDDAGHIVTNNHVVEGADKLTVTFADGTEVTAKLIGRDASSDLAVIKVDLPADRLKVVTLADSAKVKVGHLAIAIGNPFGVSGTMTVGHVSAVGRVIKADPTEIRGYSIPDVIQTDAAVNPGNSGGVLVNSSGQVIGVPSQIASRTGSSAGIAFAIPSAIVAKVVPQLIATGRYQQPYIGIAGLTLTPAVAKATGLKEGQRGALVEEVVVGSPADKAGIKGGTRQEAVEGFPRDVRLGGDVVIGIGEQPVTAFDDIITWLARNAEVGQTIGLKVLRGGKEVAVSLKLEARPSEAEQPAEQPRTASAGGAWLGILGTTMEPAVAAAMGLPKETKGVLVGEVQGRSPAAAAGLRGSDKTAEINGEVVYVGGDVIVQAKGRPVTDMNQFQELLQGAQPGETMDLKVLRDGKLQNVKVKLGELPR